MAISKEVATKTNSFLTKVFEKIEINSEVDIEKIIKDLGINILKYDFEDDISGVLVIDKDSTHIGVNKNDTEVRKRFTLAHELGHYILHGETGNMFTDKVLFRKKSSGYTSKEEKIEQEANYFAANILMPEDLIRKEIENIDEDIYDDSFIKNLATKFKVSSSAMAFRLINLNII